MEMRFKNLTFEISGIEEVRLDGDHYVRALNTVTTDGGKEVTNKYFIRMKDRHAIPEQTFINKIKRLAGIRIAQEYPITYVDNFGDTHTGKGSAGVNKYRFWFSGNTLNIEKILF
jgi:hypothetical protein